MRIHSFVRLLLALPAAIAAPWECAAQTTPGAGSQSWVFENRSYFDPFVAEIHAPDVTATVFAQGSPLQYSAKPGRRRAWTISLGKEVPVFGRDGVAKDGGACSPDLGPLRAGCSGWGVWFAIDFHMLEDFKDNSNPIIDTDYRFGGMFKYQHMLSDTKSLGLRGYYGHESTHLGDEFSLAAQRNQAVTDFQRINVSYQYFEYGISYDVALLGSKGGVNLLKFRHLGSILDPFTSWNKGYYSTDPLEVNGHTVTPSKNRYEPTFEFEWRNQSLGLGSQLTQPAGAKVKASWWRPYVSVDSRYRTIYDYAKPVPNAAERRQWSTNLVAGYYRLRTDAKRGEPDFFGRVYYGVNPYGQLRNQRNYFLFGIGVHVFV
jgi:hypothetical protein